MNELFHYLFVTSLLCSRLQLSHLLFVTTLYYMSSSFPLGLSIKYVTLFLANFDPPPLSHFVTHPGTPQSTSHILDPPPIFSWPSTKIPDKSPPYKFSLNNCSRGFLSRGFVRGSFVWKVLFGVVFVHSPLCQNTIFKTER